MPSQHPAFRLFLLLACIAGLTLLTGARPVAKEITGSSKNEPSRKQDQQGQEPVDIRWVFEPGLQANASLSYSSQGSIASDDAVQRRSFELLLEMDVIVLARLVDADRKPHYHLRFTITDISLDRDISQGEEGNRRRPNRREDARVEQAIQLLLEGEFSFFIDHHGRYEELRFSQEFDAVLAEVREETGVSLFSSEAIQNVLSESLMVFPSDQLAQGEQWQRDTVCYGWPLQADVGLNYTFAALEKPTPETQAAEFSIELAQVDFPAEGQDDDSPIPADATITVESHTVEGQAHFDISQGIVTHTEISQSYEYTIESGEDESQGSLSTTSRFTFTPIQ